MKEKIKNRVEELYEVIQKANEELEGLRDHCKHEESFNGDYMWAPGHIHPAKICSICGKCLPFEDSDFKEDYILTSTGGPTTVVAL
jgi:hypothetical protein